MTALTSFIEGYLSATVTDAIGEAIGSGEAAVAIAADVVLGGDAYRTYDSQAAVVADTADLSAACIAATAAAFAQSPAPNRVHVIRWDESGSETAVTALDRAETAGLRPPWNYLHLCILSRSAGDITSAETWASTRRVIYYAQTSGTSSVGTDDHLFAIHEDDDSAYVDCAWAGRIAGLFGRIDAVSGLPTRPGNNSTVSGLSEYATLLTTSAKTTLAAAELNWHEVVTPEGTARCMACGASGLGKQTVCADGSPFARILTILYTELLLVRELGEWVAGVVASGRDIPATQIGINAAKGRVEGRVLSRLVTAGWLQRTETYPDGYAMSYAIVGSAIVASGSIAFAGAAGSVAVSLDLVSGS